MNTLPTASQWGFADSSGSGGVFLGPEGWFETCGWANGMREADPGMKCSSRLEDIWIHRSSYILKSLNASAFSHRTKRLVRLTETIFPLVNFHSIKSDIYLWFWKVGNKTIFGIGFNLKAYKSSSQYDVHHPMSAIYLHRRKEMHAKCDIQKVLWKATILFS